MEAGYWHPDYAASLSEFGTPLRLAESQTSLLIRQIPETSAIDAMGCYPLLCCGDWRRLASDLKALDTRVVSIVAVADPLGDYTPALLGDAFDRVAPYKDHFVIETGLPPEQFVRRSHRAHAMRALNDVRVEICADPTAFIDDWERLHGVLAVRHSIDGLRRFSRQGFETQFGLPGFVMFRAIVAGQTVGLDLWYEQGNTAQGHLAAFDSTGYRLRASYATKWTAIEHFSKRVRWINLGGVSGGAAEGLAQFKRGWSTGTRPAWLCGRVGQPAVYAEITRASGKAGRYFPAYRSGELDSRQS